MSRSGVQKFDDVFFWALIVGLAIAPFWLGGNRAVAWGVNAAWACGLLVLYEMRVFWHGGVRPVAARMIWLPVLAFGATMAWSVIQSATWTPASLHHAIWGMTGEALGLNVAGSISINHELTDLAILRLATAGSVFWLALQLGRSPRRAYQLVQAIALIGAAYAIYGIIAFFVFPGTLLWLEKVSYRDVLTSTFVNRNSYATYAGMGLMAAVGMTVSAFAAGVERGSAGRQLAGFFAALAGPAGGWVAVSIVIAMALILTGSRGGVAASFLGLLGGMGFMALQARGRRGVVAGAAIMTVLLVLATVAAFGELLASRLSVGGFRSDERLAVFNLALTSIADRPLLGFGYGTFDQVFPMYRDASLIPLYKWDKAHNTYLEMVQGLGVPVSLLFFTGIGALVWRCFMGALGRRRSVTAPLVASATSFVILAHALVDFSLQIQGVALTWVALLGNGVAQSWSSEIDTSRAGAGRYSAGRRTIAVEENSYVDAQGTKPL